MELRNPFTQYYIKFLINYLKMFRYSRQFGFLKLTHPDHAKKKAVVLKVCISPSYLTQLFFKFYHTKISPQAIKYLERMLIQAQNQNERSSSNTRPNMKEEEEDIKPGDEQSLKSESAIVDGGNKNLIKIKQDDGDGDDNSDCVDDINIDPRTYCKLGHFHLLLEDYPKGASLKILF